MNVQPLVSVVLTSFNHSAYLRESIDSVLDQSFKDFELIIWDDASCDDSWTVIQEYKDSRIRAYRNEKQMRGVYGINKAINEFARGEFIAIHHSDDVWEPRKLERQIEFLTANRDYGAVFTQAAIIDEKGEPLLGDAHLYCRIFSQGNKSRYQWLRHFFMEGNALCHPSVLIRKSCYVDCGLYRRGLGQLGDFDMWIRLCLKYEIHVLPEKLIRFRLRDNEANSSGDRPQNRARRLFENSVVLDNYLSIHDRDTLLRIFPEAEVYSPSEGSDMRYALARTMLDLSPHDFVKQFSLKVLFEYINDKLEDSQISPVEFIKLTGEHDPLNILEVDRIRDELTAKIEGLHSTLAERDSQIASLLHAISVRNRQIEGVHNSISWRVTRPLRLVMHRLRRLRTKIRKLLGVGKTK